MSIGVGLIIFLFERAEQPGPDRDDQSKREENANVIGL